MNGVVSAGALDQRLQHERADEVPDGAGGLTLVWQSLGLLWASVTPVAARTERRAAQDTVQRTYRISARSQSGIRAGDRLLWRGHVLMVVAVMPRDAGEIFMHVDCEEMA